MRIALLTSTPLDFARGSGTSAGISTLARALERAGAQVQFFTPARQFPVFTLERLWFNRQLRHASFRGFDAVVGFDMDGCLMAGRHGLPHIASIKGVIADELRFEHGLTRRMLAFQARLERRHVAAADLVLTTSRYSSGRIRELYGLPRPPRVVPECIELAAWDEAFHKNPAAPDPAKFTVLSVCRFYPRKRLQVLLQAAARLRGRIPQLEVRIVGGGPEEARLLNLWRSLKLERTVRWLGDVPQGTLAREYQACDVFALPSVQEGFGIVFLEAMAAARPIVAARAAAVPEVVSDGTTGLLTAPEDEEDLAAALARVYADATLRRALGEAGRRGVRQYDAPRVAGLFLDELRAFSGVSG
ncbi:MAG TPA: glycosyltransferase family 4 protein [Bryobacteraceae bacterium]|nr:glycosyltransferase family 4 protein [Bryobacteraceae bacterium]